MPSNADDEARWQRVRSALGRGHRMLPADKEWLLAEREDKLLFRHVKTGGLYRFLHWVTIESDMTEAVAYQSLKDGRVWVRPKSEWIDGRFCAEPSHSVEAREDKPSRETLRLALHALIARNAYDYYDNTHAAILEIKEILRTSK